MKTININIHRRLRFAAAILTAGYFTAAGSVEAGDDVPFKMKGSAQVDRSEFQNATQVSVEIRNEYSGKANANQLGKHTFEGVHTLQLSLADAFSPEGTVFDVPFTQVETHTAANGDELEITMEGTFEFEVVGPFSYKVNFSNYTWTITGGTGRFMDATGSGTGSSGDSFMGSPFVSDGVISSLGSRGGNGKK